MLLLFSIISPCYNQQPCEGQICLLNKRKPQVVINHYPENDYPLQKCKQKVQRTMPGNSLYSEIVRYGGKFFIVGRSMVKSSK